MFYEIKEDDVKREQTNVSYTTLINLDDISSVSEIEFCAACSHTSYCKDYWYFKVYAKQHKEYWTFDYLTERDAKIARESLKEAIRQTIGIFEFKSDSPTVIDFDNVSNKIKDDLDLLNDMLKNHSPIETPEVKF